MTYLECVWQGKKVVALDHRYVGLSGTVLRETKSGMLFVQLEGLNMPVTIAPKDLMLA